MSCEYLPPVGQKYLDYGVSGLDKISIVTYYHGGLSPELETALHQLGGARPCDV